MPPRLSHRQKARFSMCVSPSGSAAEAKEALEAVTDTVIPLGDGAFETGVMTVADAEHAVPGAVILPILR